MGSRITIVSAVGEAGCWGGGLVDRCRPMQDSIVGHRRHHDKMRGEYRFTIVSAVGEAGCWGNCYQM